MQRAESILQKSFGFDEFRPGQAGIIEDILHGQNILAVMPTGAGKSLCYQIPALVFDRPSVIISPLVALMDNQAAGLRANGINVAAIHSGQSRDENVAQWRKITSGEAKLLYLSPERLMTARMLSAIEALNPAMFVVDEAHCVSKWGPAFRPEYDQLSGLHKRFPDAVVAAFTATADDATRKDIAGKLFSSKGRIVVQGFDRPNLDLAVTDKHDRKSQLKAFLSGKEGQSGIVYCLSRKSTEETAQFLRGEGFKAIPYHAGMPSQERYDAQERFMAEEGVIITATIAFGMGIDKPDIRFVFHMNLPSSLEAYYQEIGRAGRDGAAASTAMLYGLDDVRLRRQFISEDGSESDHQMREHKRLDALLAYCEAVSCRRQILLSYFGEDTEPCGNCDNCISPPQTIDATAQAECLFASIAQTGERFGTAHVIDVTRGADTARIKQFCHEKLAAYGTGKHMGKPYLQGLIRQAVAGGFLNMNIAKYGALELTETGRSVLGGQLPFFCKDIVKAQAKSKSTRKSKRAPVALDLSPFETELLASLKALRTELAREISKPAYVVFSDATLIDMVKKCPGNEDEMLEVSGVGETKFERYGQEFLAAIAGA